MFTIHVTVNIPYNRPSDWESYDPGSVPSPGSKLRVSDLPPGKLHPEKPSTINSHVFFSLQLPVRVASRRDLHLHRGRGIFLHPKMGAKFSWLEETLGEYIWLWWTNVSKYQLNKSVHVHSCPFCAHTIPIVGSWLNSSINLESLPSLKLTACTWKWMLGKWFSFWEGLFSRAMSVLGRVTSRSINFPPRSSAAHALCFPSRNVNRKHVVQQLPLKDSLLHPTWSTWEKASAKAILIILYHFQGRLQLPGKCWKASTQH